MRKRINMNIEMPPSYRYDSILPADSVLLAELLKATEIQQLFEAYYNLINIPVAIIDLNANVLVSSRWQRICTQFHRVHPTACSRCIQSDTQLAMQLQEGKAYSIYVCRNGLTDCASPIVIEGKHIANVFIGQFLIKEPDEALFRQQAEEFGFDTADYLDALREVPTVEAARIPLIQEMLIRVTRLITHLSIDRKRAIESQARQSIILDTIPQSVFWKDLHGRYLGCNALFARAAGLAAPDDIVGKTDLDLPWPHHEAEAYRADDQAVISANQGRLHVIEPLQQADGSRIMVDTSKIPLVDAGNTPYGLVGIFENITERNQAQEALELSEKKFGTIFRENPVPLAVSEFETGRFVEVNDACLKMMHGTTPAQMLGRTSIEIGMLTPEERTKIVEAVQTFGAHRLGIGMTRLDGERFDTEVTSTTYELSGKRYLLTCIIDVTERKQAEERIKRAAEEWLTTCNSTKDLFMLIDKGYRITKANNAASKFLELPAEKIVGYHCYELMHGTTNCPPECPLSKLQQTMKHEETEFYLDAQDIWVQVTVDPVLDEKRELLGVVHVVRDITERKVAESALSDSEARFRLLAENSTDMISRHDLEGVCLYVSPACTPLLGYAPEHLVGESLYDFVHPDDVDAVRASHTATLREQMPCTVRYRMLHANGAYVWLETINRAVHDPSTGKQEFQCASRDIAERMEAQAREREHEQQLYQVSRLASLGTLVAGIGHEINNPNNFIRLNSQNLAGFWKDIRTALDTVVRTGPGLKFRGIPYETARGMVDDLLKGIVEGSRRIERLLVNLRDFASGDEGALDQAVDLNAVVKSALVIIESSVRKSTNRFLFREAAELPHIRGNYYQLEQVVINLVTNACQALTSLEKTVRVETQRESDGRVVLRVEDEGVGIPAEDIQHLLDPFFTTRRERGGSGLGLAMTSRIIQNHGGTIGFASEVGRGTVVTVRLPPVRSVA